MADIVLVIRIQNFSAWSFYLPACASLWVYSFSSTSSFSLTHLLKNVLVGVVNLLNLCTALRIPFTKGGVGLSRVLKFLALPNKGWLWSDPCHKVINKHAVQCHSLLSGHYACNVWRFSIVRNVRNFTTFERLQFEGVLYLSLKWSKIPLWICSLNEFVFVIVHIYVSFCVGQVISLPVLGSNDHFLYFSNTFFMSHGSYLRIKQDQIGLERSAKWSCSVFCKLCTVGEVAWA